MLRTSLARPLLLALTFATAQAAAQQPIPVRTVVADGRIAETFTSVFNIKQFRNGDVMVNDGDGLRLTLFDRGLVRKSLVADTGGVAMKYGRLPFNLVDISPDSVYMIDTDARVLVMLGADGKAGRAVAFPRSNELQFFLQPPNALVGVLPKPRMDAKGRLIYRAVFRAAPPTGPPEPGKPILQEPPDTAPVLRADLDARTIDTIAKLRIPRPYSALVTPPPAQGGTSTGTLIVHPVQIADAMTVLTDGTIALVRAQDYHIDWIDPDGASRSTPKMDFAWRRLTDTEKQSLADSAIGFWKHFADSAQKAARANGNTGGGGPTSFRADSIDKMPDYVPPIGGVWPDLENHLWILPTTSHAPAGTWRFDVVDRLGNIVERVDVPAGKEIAGFGPGGAVYLKKKDGGTYTVERVKIVR